MQSSPQQVVPIRTPESSFDDDVLTVLQPDGKLNPQNDPKLPVETVVDLYKAMVRTRIVDEQLVRLQRQGRSGFHIGSLGEEACILGSAAAMRPHLFSLGAAPLALAGLAPRSLFKAELERPLPALLAEAIGAAATDVATDLAAVRTALALGEERLGGLYASSQAPAVWQLIAGLGPLTRAELARALGVTRLTASQAVTALDKADLAILRPSDHALAPKTPPRAS